MTTDADELLALASSILAETDWDPEEDVATLPLGEDGNLRSGGHWLSNPLSERGLRWAAR